MKHEEIASQLGISRQSVDNYAKIAELPDDVKQGLTDNRISLNSALSIMRKLKDEVQRAEAFENMLSGKTTKITSSPVDSNPFKNIAIVGNQAKVYRKFVDLLRPQDNEVGPNQNIVISNNHCVEREINDTSFSPIVITGNTVVPSHGWKNVFFSGNYIGPLTTGAAGPYRDAAVTTTGMSNLVFRDNWFNGTGIDAVESYPYAAQNHGDATTRRYTNSGTANITSAATSVTVTHGVEYTPLAQDIYVTPTTSWGSATKFWVSTITATTFVINCTPAPGATMTFAWQVSRRS
jgi:KorB domain.